MTDKDTTYNGWTNYETWIVNLWLSNEQSTQERTIALAQRAIGAAKTSDVLTPAQETLYQLEDTLKDYVENLIAEEPIAGMASDLVNASLGRVDWRELAEHYLEDARELAADNGAKA